jgi:hypothetical protein
MPKAKCISMALNGLEELAERLDNCGGDLKKAMGKVLDDFADTVTDDTMKAVENSNLPAKGKYSKGDTKKAIIHGQKTSWEGYVGEIPLGFDKSKPGAGGWLLTGTPKMAPDYALQNIYGGFAGYRSSRDVGTGTNGQAIFLGHQQSKYISKLNKEAKAKLTKAIQDAIDGKGN